MSSCPAPFMCVYWSEYMWDVCVCAHKCLYRMFAQRCARRRLHPCICPLSYRTCWALQPFPWASHSPWLGSQHGKHFTRLSL